MKNPEQIKCATCTNSTCLINKSCSEKSKLFLDEHKFHLFYKGKKLIYAKDNMISGIYFIQKGNVKIYHTSKDDRENISHFASSGDMIGISSFGKKIYLDSASTLEDATLCFFQNDLFMQLIKKNNDFAIGLLNLFSNELSKNETYQASYNKLNIKDKVTESLIRLKNKFGVTINNDKIILNIELSKQEMADFVGIGYADLIRKLSFLKKNRIIEYNNKKLTVYKENFSKFILSDCCEFDSLLSISNCFSKKNINA